MTVPSYAQKRPMARSQLSRVSEVITFESELGWIAASWREDLLKRLTFGHATPQAAVAHLKTDDSVVTSTRNRKSFVERICAFAAGKRSDDFLDIQLDIEEMTPFQQAVIERCRRISDGETLTYGELAEAVGHPKAARAVGSVMSNNRFPLIVPCHRVLAAGGAIGGFTAPDGINMKRRMLAAEQDDSACILNSPHKKSRLQNET
jgi:methylated-DNA-[protein]-cysteine S-methyltransferase